MSNDFKRTRVFSIVTYANKLQVQNVLDSKIEQIEAYGYILHDKDDVAPHIHIVLKTYNAKTVPQLRKWFKGIKDDDENEVSTLAQLCRSIDSYISYLTHECDDTKYHYSKSDIVEYNLYTHLQKQSESKDNAYLILQDIHRNVPYYEMVKRYGRDFIYHHEQYMRIYQFMFERNETKIFDLESEN